MTEFERPVGFEHLVALYVDHHEQTFGPFQPPEVVAMAVAVIRDVTDEVKQTLGFPSGAN